MNILVTGARGQLGIDMISGLSEMHEVKGFSRQVWDVTNEEQSRQILTQYRPDTLIHCAAYTQVDQSEEDQSRAYAVNVTASRILAELCRELDIQLVYVSTDYVFNGTQKEGYIESDAPHPINVYGRTKRLGEKWVQKLCRRHLIVRTSWLYGVHGSNFVYAILRRAEADQRLEVVSDQVGSPTFTGHLVAHIGRLIETEANGIYHVANTGSCSWYQFAQAILSLHGIPASIQSILSHDLVNRKAKRPMYSILRSIRLNELAIPEMPHWKEGLKAFIQQKERKSND